MRLVNFDTIYYIRRSFNLLIWTWIACSENRNGISKSDDKMYLIDFERQIKHTYNSKSDGSL